MKTKITCISVALLATIVANAQITTVNRNIKKEVSNVDATNLYKDVKSNSQSRTTLLKKIANKNKKGHINADWAKANEEDLYRGFIKIPTIAFPGYVKVTLTQNDKDLGPKMSISSVLDKGGAIITGATGNTENRNVRIAYFSVDPGMSYDVMVGPFYNAKSYTPPIQYELKWEYTGLQDIYEPNDTKKQAKYVNFDKIISAYAIAGHIKNYVSWSGENTYDWYSIVLTESKKIKMDILEQPSDINLVIRLFDTNGNSQYLTKESKSITSTYALSQGTYFIEVHTRLKNGVKRTAQYQSQPLPEHFKKPYKFMVKKL